MQRAAEVNSKPAQTPKGEVPKPAYFQRQAPLSDARTLRTWGSAIHLISYANALLKTRIVHSLYYDSERKSELKKIHQELSAALSAVRNPDSEGNRQEITSALKTLAAMRKRPDYLPGQADFEDYLLGAIGCARKFLCEIDPKYAAASGYMQIEFTVPGSHSKQRKPSAKENAWAITRQPDRSFRREPLCDGCSNLTWGSAIKLISHTNIIVHGAINLPSYSIKTQEEHLRLGKKLEVALVLARDSRPAKAKQEIHNALKKITGFKMMRKSWDPRLVTHGDYMEGAQEKSKQLLQLIERSSDFSTKKANRTAQAL